MNNALLAREQPPWVPELTRISERLGVDLILPSNSRYNSARLIYNRMHDLHPAALIQTSRDDSVAEIVRFAADRGILLAIRGGGHHIAGYGSCDGGLVLDFSPFRAVTLDHLTGIAEVESGARLSDVDETLCPLGLVIPTGTISETGIAGLTLGGGIGWLIGRYGLTCDQLIGADVVLANGRVVRAEHPEHNHLLWALRGGGGNFGAVTRLRYRTHPLPLCIVGSCVLPLPKAANALERLALYLEHSCPRQLTTAATIARDDKYGPSLSIDFCLSGADETTLSDLLGFIAPAQQFIQRNVPFSAWQRAFDHVFHPPMRGCWKARYGRSLTRVEIDTILLAFERAPTLQASILIEHLHGAISDTGIDTSAFPLRWALFGVLFSARWMNSSNDQEALHWVHSAVARLDPLGTSSLVQDSDSVNPRN